MIVKRTSDLSALYHILELSLLASSSFTHSISTDVQLSDDYGSLPKSKSPIGTVRLGS